MLCSGVAAGSGARPVFLHADGIEEGGELRVRGLILRHIETFRQGYLMLYFSLVSILFTHRAAHRERTRMDIYHIRLFHRTRAFVALYFPIFDGALAYLDARPLDNDRIDVVTPGLPRDGVRGIIDFLGSKVNRVRHAVNGEFDGDVFFIPGREDYRENGIGSGRDDVMLVGMHICS